MTTTIDTSTNDTKTSVNADWMQPSKLEEIEEAIHEHFGESEPTEEEVAKFIRTLPSMEVFTAAVLIGLASLALASYKAVSDIRIRIIAAGGDCPTCGKPAYSKNVFSGRWECIKGHSWD